MSAPRVPKHLKALVKAAESVGWTFGQTKGSHYRLTPPDGWTAPEGIPVNTITFSGSPSDARAFKNARADLRRLGVPV